MNVRTARLALGLLVAVAALASAPAVAAQAVIGDGGEVYRLLRGTHGELIAGAPAATRDNVALALEVVVPDGTVTRQLVPGTAGDEIEDFPSLTLDEGSNTLYVVWESLRSVHSSLHCSSYAHGAWTTVGELSGDPYSWKSNPRVATTTDSYLAFDAEGEVSLRLRTLLHLVWWDDGGPGTRALYTALVIEGGALQATIPVLDLDLLLPADESAGGATAPPGLYMIPAVVTRQDGSGVTLTFTDPESQQIAAIQVEPVPGGILAFANRARSQVLAVAQANPGSTRAAIADRARPKVLDSARRVLTSEVAEYLASRFIAMIATSDPAVSLGTVVDEARNQVIEIGAKLSRGPRQALQPARNQVIEIGREISSASQAPGTAQAMVVRRTATWAVPQLPDTTIHTLVAPGGGSIVLAWDTTGAVSWVETTADGGWSEVKAVAVGPKLSREAAYALLEKRQQQR